MKKKTIEDGTRFGMLKIITEVPTKFMRTGGRKRYFLVQCDCGEEKEVDLGNLTSGSTKSCGCLRKKVLAEIHKTHGMSKDPQYKAEYCTWQAMKDRCLRSGNKRYARYGGRGITICPEWLDFSTFLHDMGKRPVGHSIGRIDNDKGYSKENCRWEPPKQQARNTSRNNFITYKGTTQCISDWEKGMGLSVGTLHYRLARGWTVEEALTTPKNKRLKPRSGITYKSKK